MNQANQAETPGPVENGYLSQPTGYLFSRVTLFVLLAFLLLAAWNHQVVIVVLLGLILSCPRGNQVTVEIWRGNCPSLVQFSHVGN